MREQLRQPGAARRWFQRVVWIGIGANLLLSLPTLIAPAMMIERVGLPPAAPLMWPQFSALLLVLLSIFYVPAALDCDRYRITAWSAVGSRLAGVVYFFGFQREYALFGLFDLVFLVPEAILLTLHTNDLGARIVELLRRFRARLRTRRALAVAVVLVLLAGIGAFAYVQFFREEPPPHFASDEDHFLFGSIGTEASDGVPYWIWVVLPRIFPEYLPGPGGYASLGVLAKDGREMPVGFSKVTIGFERVGINCAVCHAGSYRLRPDDPQTIVAAAPAHQMAPQMYLRFLFACASDSRFNADTIMAEIARNYRMPLAERLVYRYAVIPATRRAILQLKERNTWMNSRPDWGKGRIDPFNPVKFRYLGMQVDTTIGNSDMQPVWNINAHKGYVYHWDGLNTDLQEVVLSSAVGDGTRQEWVGRDYVRWNDTDSATISSLRRIQNFIGSVPPPKYPLAIDAQLAGTGAEIYKAECANCHAPGGSRTGTLIPVEEIGTDPHRLRMWTPAAAATYNSYITQPQWKFSKFRSTGGYAAVPHDGLWMRGPYLHNGSVPTLADMLEPVENRPRMFWRGYDLFDGVRVGFDSTSDAARRNGTLFDVGVAGNSNAGHTFGTTLEPEQKRALIEYLKTL
jgi:hypothetical protein